ncbi:MAG: hypothetical protein JO121_08955 [Deltaproteobacteria bacterium]|nr:hypothetical protein [Deltaproteobacteria bacterium]
MFEHGRQNNCQLLGHIDFTPVIGLVGADFTARQSALYENLFPAQVQVVHLKGEGFSRPHARPSEKQEQRSVFVHALYGSIEHASEFKVRERAYRLHALDLRYGGAFSAP